MNRPKGAWMAVVAWLAIGIAMPVRAAGPGAVHAPDTPPTGWVPVDPGLLAEMRGGLRLPSGLQASFGFERLVHVNGELVSAMRVRVDDIGRMTPAEASQLATLGQAQLVQIGPGNTMQAQMAGLVIQNTLDNQRIQVQTTLDASVGSLGMWQATNAMQALQQASQAGLGGL